MVVAALILLVIVGSVAVAWSQRSDRQTPVFQTAPNSADGSVADASGDAGAGSGTTPARSTGALAVSGPVGELRAATFELASGTAVINLRTAELGNDLYRVSASAETRQRPQVTVDDGIVRLSLTRLAKGGKGQVQVDINAKVNWSLRVSASVTSGVFDLSNGVLAAARFAGDAASIRLRTPRLDGTLPVRITGGINQFRVETSGETAARVRIRKGTGRVQLPGRTINGVAPGRLFTAGGFAGAKNRVDIDAVAGIGSVTVIPG